MNILHISLSDSAGGADRAAYRIHSAQLQSGLKSKMLVFHKGTDDENVTQIAPRPITTILKHKLLSLRQGLAEKKWSTENPVQHHFGHLWCRGVHIQSGS